MWGSSALCLALVSGFAAAGVAAPGAAPAGLAPRAPRREAGSPQKAATEATTDTGRPEVRFAAPGFPAALPAGARRDDRGGAPADFVLPRTIRRQGAGYVATTAHGALAELTLDARLQEATSGVLRDYRIPYAGAAVLSVEDGRVLALVGRSQAEPALGAEELALTPWAPAASIFKLVSASALLATGQVTPTTRVCYHGGMSGLGPDHLRDVPKLDSTCATLAYAIGKSQNAIIAKLSNRHLSAQLLGQAAHALGFGEKLPFELPVTPSGLDVPAADELELARTAAGFWHSTLSPYHGALLAATIAHGGAMPSPYLIAKAVGTEGQTLPARPHPLRPVMPEAAAHQLATMMTLTTRMGTARHTFLDRRARPILPVTVAGKTGTLSAETDRGYIGYSWFVGFAPAEKPQIAFAVALGNDAHWRIKAAYVARQIVATYLAGSKNGGKSEGVLAAR